MIRTPKLGSGGLNCPFRKGSRVALGKNSSPWVDVTSPGRQDFGAKTLDHAPPGRSRQFAYVVLRSRRTNYSLMSVADRYK